MSIVKNPYFQEWQADYDEMKNHPKYEKRDFDNPNNVVFVEVEQFCKAMLRRDELGMKYGYTPPSSEALITILEFVKDQKILEVGAGKGYWAWLLSQLSEKDDLILATDLNPPNETFYPVQELCAFDGAKQAAEEGRVLLTIWPENAKPWTGAFVKRFRNYGGKRLIYIGEWKGCTGDDKMHDELQEHFRIVEALDLPSWITIRNCLFCLEAK